MVNSTITSDGRLIDNSAIFILKYFITDFILKYFITDKVSAIIL